MASQDNKEIFINREMFLNKEIFLNNMNDIIENIKKEDYILIKSMLDKELKNNIFLNEFIGKLNILNTKKSNDLLKYLICENKEQFKKLIVCLHSGLFNKSISKYILNNPFYLDEHNFSLYLIAIQHADLFDQYRHNFMVNLEYPQYYDHMLDATSYSNDSIKVDLNLFKRILNITVVYKDDEPNSIINKYYEVFTILDDFNSEEPEFIWHDEYIDQLIRFKNLFENFVIDFIYYSMKDNNKVFKYVYKNYKQILLNGANDEDWIELFLSNMNICNNNHLCDTKLLFDYYYDNINKVGNRYIYKFLEVMENQLEEYPDNYSVEWVSFIISQYQHLNIDNNSKEFNFINELNHKHNL